MPARRRHRRKPSGEFAPVPQYAWALTRDSVPVHISQAERGQDYVCPSCGGRMIARMGGVKRHHFAHDVLQICTPEHVAQIAASLWLESALQKLIESHQSLASTWTCPICQQAHTTDLLEGVVSVARNPDICGQRIDLALLDQNHQPRVAIALNTPPASTLTACAQAHIAVICLPVTRLHKPISDLPALLVGTTLYGGRCTTQEAVSNGGVISEIGQLRSRLTAAVSVDTDHFCGPLETRGTLSHILQVGDDTLWMPPILWARAIGGVLHAIDSKLQIVSQEWQQTDGSTIALYYVTVRDSSAVAVRRFAPGAVVTARLGTSAFRTRRITALDVARNLAQG